MRDAVQQLVDREEIRDLMARYARGVDRTDLDLVRSTYHEDAYDDHGDYKGDVDGLIDFIGTRNAPLLQSVHFLGNCLIEFAGPDVAVVETYFITAHTMSPESQRAYGTGAGDAPIQFSQFGRYVDRVERRGGPWRIAERAVVFEATRIQRTDIPPLKPEWAPLHRGRNDPIYRMRSAAGIAD
jgi:hypothetical protein